jgi:pimeloyl-ACP methyl ester carboxylesterase
METDRHVVEFGRGEPIVFVHGSFDCAEETFPKQRELADQYRVVLVDRRGYGDSPPAVRFDFDSQVDDLIAVLGRGAHLVGQSYGGVLCLLAAAARPDLVRSLTLIEPPAFSIARGHPAVETFIARLEPWFAAAPQMPKERLLPGFLRSFGLDPPDVQLSEEDLADAVTSAHEPPPWEAEVPLDRLAQASLPTFVVSGAWDIAPPEAREIASAAFRVVCDEIASRLNSERAVFPERCTTRNCSADRSTTGSGSFCDTPRPMYEGTAWTIHTSFRAGSTRHWGSTRSAAGPFIDVNC